MSRLGLSYWGGVVDNAHDVAKRGDLQELSLIMPLIRSAYEILISSCEKAKSRQIPDYDAKRNVSNDIHDNNMSQSTFNF